MSETHDAAPVDPRDIRWEIGRPRFRVHIWDASGSSCSESELAAAITDVREAIGWAIRHRAAGETAEVLAVVPHHGPGLVALARVTDANPGPAM